jgi:hypothetical protein
MNGGEEIIWKKAVMAYLKTQIRDFPEEYSNKSKLRYSLREFKINEDHVLPTPIPMPNHPDNNLP